MNVQQLTHCLVAAFEIFYRLALFVTWNHMLAKLTVGEALVNKCSNRWHVHTLHNWTQVYVTLPHVENASTQPLAFVRPEMVLAGLQPC
jgi:hypothetical protein